MSPMTVVASGAVTAIASATTAADASTSAATLPWLTAFAVTLFVEVPGYVTLARLFGSVPLGCALVGSLVVNALTHPVLYAALCMPRCSPPTHPARSSRPRPSSSSRRWC